MNDLRASELLANLLVLVYFTATLAWYLSTRFRASLARLIRRSTRSIRRDSGGPAPTAPRGGNPVILPR